MKRLYLTVEGQTEAAFAFDVLMPHLAAYGVMVHRPRFTGLHSRRGGRIPRGGLLHTFQHALADIRRWLKEDSSPDARFSMMVDLYGLPRDFPGYAEGRAKTTGRDQAEALESSLAEVIEDSRFIPYVEVHEFEALVLCDPERIGMLYEAPSSVLASLKAECAGFGSPEEINHGEHTHPKRRILQRIPAYDENIAGPLLAESIGLEALRVQCPHFGSWLTCLEGLDQA